MVVPNPRRKAVAPPPSLGELTFGLNATEFRARAKALLERAQRTLDGLLDSAQPPTVAGLLEPLNALLTGVRDAGNHGSLLFAVHPDAAVRTAGREISEAADRFYHGFRLNDRAYAALQALPLAKEGAATRFAVAKMLREMRRAGVEHEPSQRARLLALNERIDLTSNRFSENIANLDRSVELASPSELDGLPPDYIASHRPGAAGKVVLTTKYPDFGPVMAYADRGELRRRLLEAFANRAYPENTPLLGELIDLRHSYAQSLGYPSYASYAVEDKMLRTPEAVAALLERLGALLDRPARQTLDRYLERKRRDEPTATRVEPWEAQFFGPGYYDQKIRNEEFGVDMRQLRSYLPYGPVRDGLLELCRELFGLTFRRVDTEVWHASVEAYDVRDGARPLGRVYFDFVPRDGKYNHAACFPVRDGIEGQQLPQAALVCNFLVPSDAPETARIEYGEVVTFFHEFGHLLHAILSGHQRWLYNSQSNLEWDFIEAPSQLFEEWARDPATLARFAVDPDTGEKAPPELLRRLKSSEALGRPLGWLRQVALASVSLELYSRDLGERDVYEVARAAYTRYAPEPLPSAYHFEAAFGHLTGYSACYYTYAWSAVIARDLLSPFLAKGSLTDPVLARRYAREILAPGSERPAAELIRAYLGRPFNFKAFEGWVTAPAEAAPAGRAARRSSARRPAAKRPAAARRTGRKSRPAPRVRRPARRR